MSLSRFSLCSAVILGLVTGACDETPPESDAGVDAGSIDPSIVFVRYFPAEGTSFYRYPWPSDARLTPRGSPDLSDFPSRRRLLDTTAAEIENTIFGFATMPVVYFGLTAPMTDASLPQNLDATTPESTIQMIDLSVEGCGDRLPLEVAFNEVGDNLRENNMLQVANAVGTVLIPGRPYGVIILRTFGAEESRSTPRPEAFDTALRDTSSSEPLPASLEPLRRCLPDAGVALDDVAVATVFTPQDPVHETRVLHDFVTDEALETRPVSAWKVNEAWSRRRLNLLTYSGIVQMPMFQAGETPYETEGGLVFDDAGQPVIQRWEDVEIAVAMRTFETPPVGPRPVLVFIDGTGWEPWRHLRNSWVLSALDAGYVIVSFMPQFHGGRAGFDGNTEVSTFNLPNPPAARANFRQQAAETSYFVRLIRDQIMALPGLPEVDTDRLVYGGHSQGALVGALVAAVEDQFEAYVLNGLAAYLTETILFREDFLNFEEVVTLLYNFTGSLDRFHPLLQLMQLGAEVVDPHNYVRLWRGWEGNPGGNHVFVSNGYEDVTSTPRGIAHMTMTADMPPILPPGWEVDPADVWDGVPVSLPVMGNTTSFSGDPLTIATYLDFDQGHFTIYRLPFVRQLAATFFETARTGVPQLSSTSEYLCGEGSDDDLDGMIDCDDPDCAAIAPCVEGPCDDGEDNDGNGMTDCADPVCASDDACTEQECDDGMDEDGDGDVDCADSDCASRAPCAESRCGDGRDDDGDGDVDCDDSDCMDSRDCRESSCTDENDNDRDGDVDCDDSECRTSVACPELVCDDGMDNDDSGLTDCADPGCASATACVPARETSCGDSTDNDGDGAMDCADADCALDAACAAMAVCADGDLGAQVGIALFTGTLEGRPNGYPPGDCAPLGAGGEAPDIALSWTAPGAGDYVISTYGSEVDTILSVIAPDCDPLIEIACDDDEGPVATSNLTISVTDGEMVVIVIGAYDAEEDAGPIQLHIFPVP